MLLVFSIDEVFKDEFEEREYKLLQLSGRAPVHRPEVPGSNPGHN